MLDTHAFSESTDIAREVARRMLGQNASCDDVSAHRLACDLLRQQAFCPQMDRRQAIVTLSSPLSLIDHPDFSEQIAVRRLDAFARHLFSLPITERRLHWCLLSKQLVRMPQLHWRLRNLEKGLLIDSFGTATNPAVVRLANQICEMFVMTASECRRTLEGICIAAAKKDRGRELGDTIDELYRTLPEVADLKPMVDLPEMLRRFRSLREQKVITAPIEPWQQLRQTLVKPELWLLAILFFIIVYVYYIILSCSFGYPKTLFPQENDLSPYEKSQFEKYGFHVDEIKRRPSRKDDRDLTNEEKEASERFLKSLDRLDSRKNRDLRTPENEGVERLKYQESEQADE